MLQCLDIIWIDVDLHIKLKQSLVLRSIDIECSQVIQDRDEGITPRRDVGESQVEEGDGVSVHAGVVGPDGGSRQMAKNRGDRAT